MAEKTLKTRIIHKHEPEANWKLATGFTPKKGEIIVYDIDEIYNYERFKIGDGVTNVNDLPFANDNFSLINVDKLVDEYSGQDYINIEPKELGFLALQAKDAVILRSTEGSVGLTAKEIVIEPTEETRIKKLATPSDQNDAANKEYVDNFLPLEKGQGNNAFQQKLDYTNFKPANINVQSSTEVLKDENGNVLGGAFGDYSATFSGTAQAKGKRAVAEGSCTTALGKYSHAEGNETFAAANNSHVEGLLTTALNEGGHAEGTETIALGAYSHVEGKSSKSTGDYSHAEGIDSETIGSGSHAEGSGTCSEGLGAHSEGIETEAIGDGSHAEGYKTTANGLYSHASGAETVAGYSVQTVVGRHNSNKEHTLFEVGNGEANAKSNAFEVYSDGHAEVQNVGVTNNSIITKGYLNWNNIADKPNITTTFTNWGSKDLTIEGEHFTTIKSGDMTFIDAGTGVDIKARSGSLNISTSRDVNIYGDSKVNIESPYSEISLKSNKMELTSYGDTNINTSRFKLDSGSDVHLYSHIDAYINATNSIKISAANINITSDVATTIKNVSDPVNEKDAVNKRYVDSILGQSLSGGLTKQLVTAINGNKVIINGVETDAIENVIYLLKDEKAIGEDVYKEYILIGDPAILTMIGDTSTPLLGSVIFNNKNNKAYGANSTAAGNYSISGTKCFTITATSVDGSNHIIVSLDSVDGIEVGQKCRFKINSEYYSEVLEINGNSVTLNALNSSAYDLELYTANTAKGEYTDSENPYLVRSADGTDVEKNSLFIIGHPEIGTDRILGDNAAAFGSYNNASSLNTFVAGSENNALGGFSAVFGKTNSAAYCGIVGGRNNDARLSEYGATFGYKNIYTGQSNYAFAAGGQNELNGAYTVALGGKNKINGVGSSALGIANETNGNYSNAFGYYNKTNSNYQVAVGTYNEPIVDALFMVGNGTKNSRSNAFVVQKDGDVLIPRTATIYGELNLAGPMIASDMINANKGIVSTVYSGVDNTIVLNTGANKATGKYSIAGGANTNAKGYYSTALGYYTVADKVATFVAGANNTSNANYQTIFGSFANNTTDSLFTVGNGSSSAKSNAFDVTKDGKAYLGNANIDETNDKSIVTKKYADTKLSKTGGIFNQGEKFKLNLSNINYDYYDIADFSMDYNGIKLTVDNNADYGMYAFLHLGSHGISIDSTQVEIKNLVDPIKDTDAANKKYVDTLLPLNKGQGNNAFQQTLDYDRFTPANIYVQLNNDILKDENGSVLGGAFGDYSATFSGTAQAKGKRAVAEGSCTVALGKYSHAEGNETLAQGNHSHVEGLMTTADGEGGHAEGTETRASGEFTHAEGKGSEALGPYSHAEGIDTSADGSASHAEGSGSAAGSTGAHAEGINTSAQGEGSHTEGYKTVANGLYSHAAGAETYAGGTVQYVIGRHNNNKENTLFEVGNGSDQSNKSNAFEVYNDGHAEVQTQGTTDNSIVTKKYVDDNCTTFETGTWTPIFNTNGIIYNIRIAKASYVKIANQITITLNCDYDWDMNLNITDSDWFNISGLPFTGEKYLGIPTISTIHEDLRGTSNWKNYTNRFSIETAQDKFYLRNLEGSGDVINTYLYDYNLLDSADTTGSGSMYLQFIYYR